MPRTRLQLDAERRARVLRHSIADEFAQLRTDSGAGLRAVAALAGVSAAELSRLERGLVLPSIETYVAVAQALGADLRVRLYPNTGPAVRDRWQARILEALLRALHPRWKALPEVIVRRPVRGVIDVVLVDPMERVIVAAEIHSELRRIEQQLRWSQEKTAALPSSDGWAAVGADGMRVERLLVLRSTAATREAFATFPNLFAAAYPASPTEALASLRTDRAWPAGSAVLWASSSAIRTTLFAQPRRPPRRP